eukprot:gb/GECH01013032.1/.p1 GENE.gb/GECH01013032.1/~~gb/GECH01013032.1/.p1  ORF type:complete len:361 (+),score=67.05 gb/GECH01013032.1/:1-1083(+)
MEIDSPWMIIIMIAYISTSWLMYLCSIKEVYKVRKQAKSTYYSPLPYLVMFFSCFSWCIWSTLKQDYVNFASYVMGAWASIWYMTSVFPLSEYKLLTEVIAVIASGIYSLFLFLLVGYLPLETSVAWLGRVSVAISVTLYISPLVQMVHVIRIRDSSTMPLALIITASFCTILWAFYGWLTDALPVIIVNSTAGTVNWIQLIVTITFHPKWRRAIASFRWRWITHYLGISATPRSTHSDDSLETKQETKTELSTKDNDKSTTDQVVQENDCTENHIVVNQEMMAKNESENEYISKTMNPLNYHEHKEKNYPDTMNEEDCVPEIQVENADKDNDDSTNDQDFDVPEPIESVPTLKMHQISV